MKAHTSPENQAATTLAGDLRRFLNESWLNVLLIFIPVSLALEMGHVSAAWVFVTSALAIVPLAGLIGQATEATTEHTGPGLGGLLNASFGNAPELIIALMALHAHLYRVVKASITGSILGNMLLVLGLSMVAGGWRRERQTFSQTAATAAGGMLMLAVTALVMPAAWELVVFGSFGQGGENDGRVQTLSLLTSVVLMVIYAASLVFSLGTHRDLVTSGHEPVPESRFRLRSSMVMLLAATVLTAIESEILVHSIHPAAEALHLTELFVGVIVVAVVGNAAEHYTAVLVASKGKMDLAFHIAIGSSTQIALFVAPVLVFASFLYGRPMALVFHPFEIVALALAVLNVGVAALDGESNWFEGLQLIAVYLILAFAFYFVPAPR